jgi:hypothetical protein
VDISGHDIINVIDTLMTGSIYMQDAQQINAIGSLTIVAGTDGLAVTAGITGDLNLTSATRDVNISAGPTGAINTIGSIIPGYNNLYTLGTSAYRWADAYIGPASLHFGSTTEDIVSLGAIAGAGGTGLSISGSLMPSITQTYDLGTSAYRWNSISVALNATPTAAAYQSQMVLYNTATSALSYDSDAYSCVLQTGSGTVAIALATTERGRTYIVTAATTISFTPSLTANDGGFFVIIKNGKGLNGGDITISGISGVTKVHETTSTQNGQIVYIHWNGTTLTAY